MTSYGVINSRAPRIDAPDKATGRAVVIDDLLCRIPSGRFVQDPEHEIRRVVDIAELDIKDGYVVFKHEGVDFSDLRRRYLREHHGWKDQPEGDRLTFCEASRIAYLARGSIIDLRCAPPLLNGISQAQLADI